MDMLAGKILSLLEKDSRLTDKDMAIMLNASEEEVRTQVARLEAENVICGYHTIINWDKAGLEGVTAMVEMRVTPQSGEGYRKLASKIKVFPQVTTLYLMSGTFDFLIIVRGRTLKELSLFVSDKLASMDDVVSTNTHFTLTKYKELGADMFEKKKDERMVVT